MYILFIDAGKEWPGWQLPPFENLKAKLVPSNDLLKVPFVK
jgi:hypothetical protein